VSLIAANKGKVVSDLSVILKKIQFIIDENNLQQKQLI